MFTFILLYTINSLKMSIWEVTTINILFFLTPKAEVAFLENHYSLRQALEKMEHYKYSAIPILNGDGEYIGTIPKAVFYGIAGIMI